MFYDFRKFGQFLFHKLANKPQSKTNFVDLSRTPEKINKNKKRTHRIMEDTSSDEETKTTRTKEKKDTKGNKTKHTLQ